MNLHALPVLFKLTSKGAVQEWRIHVESLADGTAQTVVVHGQRDGKMQTSTVHVATGKNLGKKNATTPYTQAVSDATSKWNKQIDKGYSEGEPKPMPSTKPMLAEKYQKFSDIIDWQNCWVQPKLDGIRCVSIKQGGNVSLFSRLGKQITTVPHIVEELSQIMRDGEIWDGELYIHRTRFQVITSLVKKAQAGTKGLEYHVYDAANANTFENRYLFDTQLVLARNAINPEAKVKPVDTRRVYDGQEVSDAHDAYVASGYEGLIVRHGMTQYKTGYRSRNLLKLKASVDDEFTIVGVKQGVGKFKGLGIFRCVTAEGHEFDATPRGTEAERREFWRNRKSYIGKLLTVRFYEWSSSEASVPRFPIGISVRDYE